MIDLTPAAPDVDTSPWPVEWLQSYCFDFAKPAGLVAKVRAKFTL